jgi:hypothetical protein
MTNAICNNKQTVLNFLRIVAAFAAMRNDASMQHIQDFYSNIAQIQRDYADVRTSTFSIAYVAMLAYANEYAKHFRVSADNAMRISNALNEACFHDAQIYNLHNLNSEEIHSIISIIDRDYDETLFDYIESEDYELFLE